MKTIYICGGWMPKKDPKAALSAKKAKARLRSIGYTAISPQKLGRPLPGLSATLQDRIAVLKKCNAVYVMPGWADDVLSRIELAVALDLGLGVIYHPAGHNEMVQALRFSTLVN